MEETRVETNTVSAKTVSPYTAPPQGTVPPMPTQGKPSPKPPRYTASQGAFGLLFCLLGWLFVRGVLTVPLGIGAALYFCALLVLSVAFLCKNGKKIRAGQWCWAAILALFSLGFVWQSSATVTALNMMFVGGATLLWCASVGDGRNPLFRSLLFTDTLKAVFMMPFSSFGACIGAVFGLFGKNRKQARIGYVFLGLAIALIPTLVVGALLTAGDTAFRELISFIFSDVFESIGTFVWQFILGLPLAFYLFGLVYSTAQGKATRFLPDEDVHAAAARMRKVPSTVWYAGLTPLCILYVLFFVSQFAYYTSAFARLLPDGYSYAEYAREGFFQLTVVAVINLVALVLMRMTVRRTETGALPVAARVYGTVVSVFTLLLVATALRKMILYVERFGLTPRRVYTTIFMILLAVVFVLLALAVWNKYISVVRGSAAAAVVLLGMMLFLNVDACIARYNTARYQNGTLSTVDTLALYELGDAALPSLIELADDSDPTVAQDARLYVETLARRQEDRLWLSFNLTSHRAEKALTEYRKTHPKMSDEAYYDLCDEQHFWDY